MKCKSKDCIGCVHYINIRTHHLFKDFIIKGENGKAIDFEGCIFHLSVLFQRQSWIRQFGIQAAIESRGDATANAVVEMLKLATTTRKRLNPGYKAIEERE